LGALPPPPLLDFFLLLHKLLSFQLRINASVECASRDIRRLCFCGLMLFGNAENCVDTDGWTVGYLDCCDAVDMRLPIQVRMMLSSETCCVCVE